MGVGSKIWSGVKTALPVVGEIGGSLFSSALAARSAQKQMDFQERMSSTAHQREVADLRAAGLNPVLSAMGGSGASSPSGAMFTPDNPARGVAAYMQLAKQTAANVNKIGEEMKTMVTQQALNSAAAAREVASAKLSTKQLDVADAEMYLKAAMANLTGAQKEKVDKEIKRLEYEMSRSRAEAKMYDMPVFGDRLPLIDKILKYIITISNIRR